MIDMSGEYLLKEMGEAAKSYALEDDDWKSAQAFFDFAADHAEQMGLDDMAESYLNWVERCKRELG